MTNRIGMYVHMHWGYGHPYAARTWTLEDWDAYLEGLSRLGYSLVQIWPMIDTMPHPPADSDILHLEKIRAVIKLAHDRYHMIVTVGGSANTVGNARAADFPFESRPYFQAEELIDPDDSAAVERLMAHRRILLDYLKEADGFWIIDADPGGWPGARPDQFARLFAAHRRLLDSLRPGICLIYWMWWGWRDRSPSAPPKPEAAADPLWHDTLAALKKADLEPWRIHAQFDRHFEAAADNGLIPKVMYYPYNTVEFEPSYPFTAFEPGVVADNVGRVPAGRRPQGILGNAQSHCLQLPHTYYFAHCARGGTLADADLAGFADRVAPGAGADLAAGWLALGGEDPEALESAAAALRSRLAAGLSGDGDLAGLAFRDPGRLVLDLALQGELLAAVIRARDLAAAGGPDAPGLDGAMRRVTGALEAWNARHGFRERYWGFFFLRFHKLLDIVAPECAPFFGDRHLHDGAARILQTLQERWPA